MRFNSKNVLLVEDNQDDAELIIRTLKKSRIANQINWVSSGEEALDFIDDIENGLPTLILLDLKLPGINGDEVLKGIRDRSKSRSIPVVLLTSSDDTEDINKIYELGVNSYIVKPVSFEKFANAIEQLGMYWLVLNEYKE
ncbi:MAG: response regulator [candidate division Zixibacteria bacterium]|nr:response regulator [candidate division Zixibacteria bacterium]